MPADSIAPLNVLVADLTQTSGYYLRSVLRSAGHRASLAFTREGAMAKVSTGLFDVVIADVDVARPEGSGLLREVAELCPGLPLVLATEWATPPAPLETEVFCVLEKPLRIARIADMLDRAADHLRGLSEKRRHLRRVVDLSIEIVLGAERLRARATNLSLGGVQVEAPGAGEAWRRIGRSGAPVQARLRLGDGAALDLPARLAYVEAFPGDSEQVGLAFTGLATSQRNRLEAYLTR
ncbi:MAG: PilZ domain-containing protein [Planctomycetales bacterium]|nr:PilZ domain-containing protein [Planctomycetales bacterium]